MEKISSFVYSNSNGGKLKNGRIFSLDLVRLVAVFMVVFYHYMCAVLNYLDYFSVWGRVGVGMFFMISGAALINGYYYKFSAKSFYKKRIRSIYLPFYTAYFLTYLYLFVKNGFHNFIGAKKFTFILTLLGIDGYCNTYKISNFYLLGEWFLGVIIFIYLIFPLWRKIFIKFPTATLISLFVFRVAIIYKNIFSIPVCFNIITAISYFTFGAYIMLLSSGRILIDKNRIKILILCVICLAVGIWISHRFQKFYAVDIGEMFSSVGLFGIIALMSKYIKISVLKRFIAFICGISYEIFLVHHIIIYQIASVVNANLNKLSFIIGGFAIALFTMCVAYLVNRISGWMIRGISCKKQPKTV